MDAKRQELMDEISEFLRSHTENDLGDFDEDSQLLADLGFNSLDFLTIINDAEVEFDSIEMADSFTAPDYFFKEVTQDSAYQNSSLSSMNPEDIKDFIASSYLLSV